MDAIGEAFISGAGVCALTIGTIKLLLMNFAEWKNEDKEAL